LIWNIRVAPYDDISWLLFVEGGFQVAEIQALLRWAQHSGVFSGSRNVLIDAGANLGTTCMPMVRAAGCRALAIEPVAANFSWLRQNVESNGLTDKILLANKAIALQPGRLRMCLTGTSGGHFIAGADGAALRPDLVERCEDVEADTLSGIVAAAGLDAGEIALVWADVQGCELAVIESGSEFWARGIPLWAEIEPHSLRRQGTFDIFAAAVAAHFDRFIEAPELIRLGAAAVPRPIAGFADLVAGITPEQINTDVLLLPRAFSARPQ
jgi:FkbM family methyltransferase